MENNKVMAWFGDQPVYADRERKLADVASSSQIQAWKPANIPAQKLFCCIECMRDLDVLVQACGRIKNKTKLRRNLKILHTPLHSLVEAIRNLTNDLENNPDTFPHLPDGARPLVGHLRSQLLLISTVEKGGLLSRTRDKIAAHVDRDLSADEMQALLKQADSSQIGMWIHACIAVLSDLVKLPVYFWYCQPEGNATARILFKEPFVVTLGVNDKGIADRLLCVHLVPKPPRRDVVSLMMRLVKNSKWMFGPRSQRILSFIEDAPSETWAKSLTWLPKVSKTTSLKLAPSIVHRFSVADKSCLLIPFNVPFFIKQSGPQQIRDLSDMKAPEDDQ